MKSKMTKRREEYFSEPRYRSKVDDGAYKYGSKKNKVFDSDSEDDFGCQSDEENYGSLMERCIKVLNGKQKTNLSLLDVQYPKIHEYIIDEIKEIKEDIHDSITQLYYDQIHYRYPEMVNRSNGVHQIPLLKCCLMNQSIRVVATNEPLILDILPV